MGKLLILFLSFFLAGCFGYSQKITILANSCDCTNKKVKDSLIEKYLEHGAEKYSYNSPPWQQYCDSLIAICPNIAVAYQLKAIPFIKYGEYEKAFALEDKAVELAPKDFTAYRGFLKCIFTKDYEGAIADFKKAQELVPNSYEMDHTYFFYQGLCYLELGNYVKCQENFKQDIFLQNKGDSSKTVHFNSLFYLGILYYEMKNFTLAEENLLKCIKVYNNHPDANFYLGLVFGAIGNDSSKSKYLNIAKEALEKKYSFGEDNVFYANYPHQIRLYEVEEAINAMR